MVFIFGSIINYRLQEWLEIMLRVNTKLVLRKTTLHFTLSAIIQKQFAKNRRLYVAFIDFEKAFDSISRKFLLPIKNGIGGNSTGVLKTCITMVNPKLDVVQNSVIIQVVHEGSNKETYAVRSFFKYFIYVFILLNS